MSHPFPTNRQIELRYTAVELAACPVQTIQPLAPCHLRCLADFGAEIENQGEVGHQPVRRGAVGWQYHFRREAPPYRLIRLCGHRETVRKHHPAPGQGGSDQLLHQVRPGGQVEEQLRDGTHVMVGVEQRLPRDLRGAGATRLPDHQRIQARLPHPIRQGDRQRGLARPLRALEYDEQTGPVHPSVMMLLVAPFSMPSLICWFTRAISFSKFDRATTYACPTGLVSRSRTAFSYASAVAWSGICPWAIA